MRKETRVHVKREKINGVDCLLLTNSTGTKIITPEDEELLKLDRKQKKQIRFEKMIESGKMITGDSTIEENGVTMKWCTGWMKYIPFTLENFGSDAKAESGRKGQSKNFISTKRIYNQYLKQQEKDKKEERKMVINNTQKPSTTQKKSKKITPSTVMVDKWELETLLKTAKEQNMKVCIIS